MLLYHCPEVPFDPEAAARDGIQSPPGHDLRLHASLEAARRVANGPILVVDPRRVDVSRERLNEQLRVPTLSPAALQNVAPYRPPNPVRAGGGYVARMLPDDVAVLLIHRRGVWDLPKGHQDAGEDIETCALREVREEVGINELNLCCNLGTTQHGYPEGEVYTVKTTHWYLMHTPERTFNPERQEGIDRVAWARWTVARQHIGYDTLCEHMDRVESNVRTAFS